MSMRKNRQDQSRVGGRIPAGICHGFWLSTEAGLVGYRLVSKGGITYTFNFRNVHS